MAEEPPTPFRCRAIANFAAGSDSQISIVEGQEYEVQSTDGRGVWWQTTVNGVAGWFPASYTEVIPSLPSTPSLPPTPIMTDSVSSDRSNPLTNSGSNVSAKKSGGKKKTGKKKTGKKTGKKTRERPPIATTTLIWPEKMKTKLPTSIKVQVMEAKIRSEKAGKFSCWVFMKELFSSSKDPEKKVGGTKPEKVLEPKWNEQFHIYINDPEAEALIIRVVASDKYDPKKLVGELVFPLRASERNFDAPNFQYEWYALKRGTESTGDIRLFLEYTDDRVTSAPTNFKREGHIGWSAEGGFDIDNIPPEWKQMFKNMGIRKKDLLEDQSYAKDVFDIMQNAGDSNLEQAPTAPPMNNNTPQTPQPIVTTGGPSGGPAPPPPPPPPGVKKSGSVSSSESMPKPATPPPVVQEDGRGDLLASIRGGGISMLKSTKDAPRPEKPVEESVGLEDTLKKAMLAHRKAMTDDDDDDDWSDDDGDEWDEE